MRAILTWHSLDRSGSPISVPPEEFRRQVEWLTASGVRAVTVGKLLELAKARGTARNLRYTRGDMRRLPARWTGRFDAVLNLFHASATWRTTPRTARTTWTRIGRLPLQSARM